MYNTLNVFSQIASNKILYENPQNSIEKTKDLKRISLI